MSVATTGTLAKWGNSQGVRIPKDICELLGVQVGSAVSIEADQARSEVILVFEKPGSRYQRNRRVSMEELCAGWSGEKVGEEWGGPDVGAEVVS